MSNPTTYDDIMSQAIGSGLLNDEEIQKISEDLFKLRELARLEQRTRAQENEFDNLHSSFNALVAKGLPHLVPKVAWYVRYTYIILAILVFIIFILNKFDIKSSVKILATLAPAIVLLKFFLDTRKVREEMSNEDIKGKTLVGNSAIINGKKYSLTLKFIVNERELFIRSDYPPPYRALFVLSKLVGVKKREVMFSYVYLTYVDDPNLKIRISEALAREIQRESKNNWSYII